MVYFRIIVVGKDYDEVHSITVELLKRYTNGKLKPNNLEKSLEYETHISKNSGGKVVVKENKTHDYDRPLTKHLGDML